MPELSTAERQALINKADSAAYRALRKAHQQEFNQHKQKAAAELGLDWTPRASAEERARKQINALLSEHPELQAELAAALTKGEVDPATPTV